MHKSRMVPQEPKKKIENCTSKREQYLSVRTCLSSTWSRAHAILKGEETLGKLANGSGLHATYHQPSNGEASPFARRSLSSTG